MATYTILTTREQEIGLGYAHEHYAEEGQTKAQFLQSRVSLQVLDPMWASYQHDTSVSLEKSIATIPEANEAQASQEIQDVIVANGGTIVPASPPLVAVPTPPPPPPPIPPAGDDLSALFGQDKAHG